METAIEKKDTWQTAKPNTFKGLLAMLKKYTLDPTFENYGNFCYTQTINNFHPSHRKEQADLIKNGFVHFSGNFLSVSWAFQYDTNNETEIKQLKEAINKNKERPEYKEAFLDNFNAIGFETTYCLTEKEYKSLKGIFSDKWWNSYKSETVLNISEREKIPAVLKQLKKEADKNKPQVKFENKEPNIEPYFFERHYLPEEWDEVRELFKDRKMFYQFSRTRNIDPADLPKFKEHTFKATGRKILYQFTKYFMIYKEM